ncbi:MAG: energy transducer TonB [Cyclobacteriaceae bacterium]|nr:energy transducer TonB [Cyclobacteriaceae bacterium]
MTNQSLGAGLILALVVLLDAPFAEAQKNDREYIDEFGFTVDSAKASYYRVVRMDPNDKVKLHVEKYYLNDTLAEYSTFFDKYLYTRNGVFRLYYDNGRPRAEGNFQANQYQGKWTRWYRNGQIKEVVTYDDDGEPDFRKRLESFWDSLGNQLVTAGNGIYVGIGDDPVSYETGQIANGFKEGIWKGHFSDGRLAFEEHYKRNKLVKGVSYDSVGKQYKYKKVMQLDLNSFYSHLVDNLVYPESARRQGISGLVIVQIIVQPDGHIRSRVAKGLEPECDKMALLVVNQYKGTWMVMKSRGQFVRRKVEQEFLLPVVFKLH